jgi:hypothetical protein
MAQSDAVTLRSHPSALASIRRTCAWAALIAFALVGLLSLRAHVPAADALARALVAGVLARLAAWAIAQAVWRQVVVGQLRQAEARRAELRERRLQAARDAAEA